MVNRYNITNYLITQHYVKNISRHSTIHISLILETLTKQIKLLVALTSGLKLNSIQMRALLADITSLRKQLLTFHWLHASQSNSSYG